MRAGWRGESAKPSPRARLRAYWQAIAWMAWVLAASLPRLGAAPAVGAYADLASLPLKAATAELDRLAKSGVVGVRLPLDWNRVEPRPNRFTWKADDAVVNAARARGLEVVLVLGDCAVWAVPAAWQIPAHERRFSVPWSLTLWERYVRQSVSHFRGRVRFWQVREQPNARRFRGARSEYLRLVASAARAARGADPLAAVIVPEAGAMDVAEVDRLCSTAPPDSCDVFGLYLPPTSADPSASSLAWAVLSQEILPRAQPSARHPVWVLGGDSGLPVELWMQQYLLASAFGVQRIYLPSQAVDPAWVKPLSRLRYLGFLRLGPEVWALAFADRDQTVLAAWSVRETALALTDLAQPADESAVRQAAPVGAKPGSAVSGEGEALKIRLGPRPTLVAGLEVKSRMQPGPPTRSAVLAARPGPDLSHCPSVSADYGRRGEPEAGLYNRSLRQRTGGRIEEETREGRVCLRARVGAGESLSSPWIFFDVDDRWLYLGRGETPVAITVECLGSYLGERMLGFNIMYDSMTGYRFTPWQWVAPGHGFHRYRFELWDVSFGNRDGYDFRINAQGSKQDLWVSSVTVEKLDAAAAPTLKASR